MQMLCSNVEAFSFLIGNISFLLFISLSTSHHYSFLHLLHTVWQQKVCRIRSSKNQLHVQLPFLFIRLFLCMILITGMEGLVIVGSRELLVIERFLHHMLTVIIWNKIKQIYLIGDWKNISKLVTML